MITLKFDKFFNLLSVPKNIRGDLGHTLAQCVELFSTTLQYGSGVDSAVARAEAAYTQLLPFVIIIKFSLIIARKKS